MIGIRREDKSPWETRVPLVPENIRRLVDDHDIAIEIEIEGSAHALAPATPIAMPGRGSSTALPPTRSLSA